MTESPEFLSGGQIHGLPAHALARMAKTVGEAVYVESVSSATARITVSLQGRRPLSRQPQDATLSSLPPADLQKLLEGALRETLLRLSL